jgi:hypothetical protein
VDINRIYRAPSIPKLSKKNISSSIFGASKLSLNKELSGPKLKVTKFGFQKSSEKLKDKFESLIQSPPENKDTQSSSDNKDTQEALVETNRILVEIQKQLSYDFAMRIAEEKSTLKKIKASEAKRRVFDKENAVEGGAKKLTDVGKNVLNKLTQPVKSIFDKIKEFFGLIVTNIVLSKAFKWLQDPKNKKLLDQIFYWIGKAFVPAVIAIIGYKVFKWIKRLWTIGKFLWRLPGRLLYILSGGRLGAKAASSVASSATNAAVKGTTASAYASTKAGKAYAAMQAQRNLPKWAQRAAGGSASRFAASNERIIQGTANLGDKLRVGSRMRGMPGIGGIAESISNGAKGLVGKIGGEINSKIGEKFISPIINVVLPKIPSKVRTKIASAVAKKGLGKFLPFVNTILGTVEGASRLLEGDTEGALLSFASAIPIAGWAALALDIYRSVDPEGYTKNIRMGMKTEDMNAALNKGFSIDSVASNNPGLAAGGTVPGSGPGNVDSVRTNLAPGEEVINTSSAMLFRPLLKDINDNSGRLWTTFSKSVGKLSASAAYQKDVSEEYSKVIDEFNENIKKSIDKKKKPRPNPNPNPNPNPPPASTTPPPAPTLPSPTGTPTLQKKDEEKKDQPKLSSSGGGSMSGIKPEKEPGQSITPSASTPSGMMGSDTSADKGGMQFLQMDLPDSGGMPRIPQPPSQATDVTVISPINPTNPFMDISLDWYGIHMR